MKITIPQFNKRLVFAGLLAAFFLAYIISTNFHTTVFQHSVIEAESIIKGQLNFIRFDAYGKMVDMVPDGDKYYWALGPAPTFILIPFVGIARSLGVEFFTQGYLQYPMILLSFYLLYKLARKFNFSQGDALILSVAFCFGSVYASIVYYAHSWYYTQVVAVLFVLLALYEYYSRRRYWLIGIYLAVVFATRITAALTVFFFLLQILLDKTLPRNTKTRKLAELLILLSFGVLFVGVINYLKFGNPFDNGYTSVMLLPEDLNIMREKYGLFNLETIITNVYWSFINVPQPVLEGNTYRLISPYLKIDPRGLSFVFVAPAFLRIFAADMWKKANLTKEKVLLAFTSIVILLFVLSYFANGYAQYGPRYLNDLLPLWYILLLLSFKDRRVGKWFYLLVAVSSLVNLYFMFIMFSYSVFGV